METRRVLFENEYIELYDEQCTEDIIASIHNKTDKDIVIKFGNNGIDDIKLKADSWQDLFDDFEDFTALALLVKSCFTVEIVEHKNDLEELNEEILLIVKNTIKNSLYVCEKREMAIIDSSDFDYIAEEIAEEVCKLIAKAKGE